MAKPNISGQSLVDKVFDKLSEKIETPVVLGPKITKKGEEE